MMTWNKTLTGRIFSAHGLGMLFTTLNQKVTDHERMCTCKEAAYSLTIESSANNEDEAADFVTTIAHMADCDWVYKHQC